MLESRQGRRTAYRSIRYSTGRADVVTADPRSLPKFRIKQNFNGESTFFRSDAFQTKLGETVPTKCEDPQNPAYLQTFHSLFSSQMRAKESRHKLQPRVIMPNFNKQYDAHPVSEFTLLDNFYKPYNHILVFPFQIQNQANKCEKQLNQQKDQLKMLRFNMDKLKAAMGSNLKGSEDEALRVIHKFKAFLRKNETTEHERKLRIKSEIEKLEEGDQQFKKIFNEVHGKAYQMQTTIFNCQPFELKMNQQEDTQQLYF